MADFELLERLCSLNGISGREDHVRSAILAEIRPHCSRVIIDPLGNIIAEKQGVQRPKRRLMLDAHMDEVGLIATYIDDNGLIRFEPVGGIDEKVLAGIPVRVGDRCIPGVIGVKPIHLCRTEEREKPVPLKDLAVDIGADTRADAEALVQPGDAIHFCSPYGEQDGVLHGKAFDDRAGCAVLIELIRSALPYDMTFVFAVQEETGLHGAQTAAFTVAPDAAIVLESTTAGDVAGTPAERQACRMGHGAVVSFMDRQTIYDRGLYELALDSARKAGAAAQPKQAVAGGNDAGVIHRSRGGVRTIAVSLPCRYLHTPVGLIAKSDYEAVLETVRVLAGRIAGGEG